MILTPLMRREQKDLNEKLPHLSLNTKTYCQSTSIQDRSQRTHQRLKATNPTPEILKQSNTQAFLSTIMQYNSRNSSKEGHPEPCFFPRLNPSVISNANHLCLFNAFLNTNPFYSNTYSIRVTNLFGNPMPRFRTIFKNYDSLPKIAILDSNHQVTYPQKPQFLGHSQLCQKMGVALPG